MQQSELRCRATHRCITGGEKAPSEMLTALVNLGGSCAAISAAAPWPALPDLAAMPACIPLKADSRLRGSVGEGVLLEAGTALPDVAALPGCMPFMAGAGLAGKLGKGLSSGGLRKGLACLCGLACLPPCLGCSTCPAQQLCHISAQDSHVFVNISFSLHPEPRKLLWHGINRRGNSVQLLYASWVSGHLSLHKLSNAMLCTV